MEGSDNVKGKLKIIFSLFLLMMMSLFSSTIQANDQKGSILISLKDTEKLVDKTGVQFEIAKVANYINGSFETINGLDIDFNMVETAEQMELVAYEIRNEVNYEQSAVTDQNGQVYINDLSVGLYLVNMKESGSYENITPFLVSVPMFDEVEKVFKYEVKVIPKSEPYPQFVVHKIDSMNHNHILYKDFEFAVYKDKDCTEKITSLTTDISYGVASFIMKKEGKIYLKEVKAPDGYSLSKEVITIELNKNKVLINGKVSKPEFGNIHHILFKNTLVNVKVPTGDYRNIGLLITILFGSGMMIVVLDRMKKKGTVN